jgi:hypothetical protein
MKRSPALLLSLALNVVLIGAVLRLTSTRSASPAPSQTGQTQHVTSKAPIGARPSAAVSPASSDIGQWLAQLREAGVPSHVLARLIAADFATRWEKRRDQMQERWERGEIDDDDWAQFHRQRDVDEESAIRSALGEESFKAWHEEKLLTGLHLDRIQLSPAERDGVYNLRRDMVEQQRDLDRKHRVGEIDDNQLEKQQDKLQSDYDAKTKALLGDDRFATLQQPASTTIGALRRSLQNLNVPSAKVDAVIASEQQWQEQRTAIDRTAGQEAGLSPEAYQAKLNALDQEHDAALQRELGPDGLEALRQMQDERYRKLTKYAQLWQLSSDEVNNVYDALRNYGPTVDEYRRQAQSRGLAYDATQPAIDHFRQTTAASLRASLGDAKYNQLAGSDVLNWDR